MSNPKFSIGERVMNILDNSVSRITAIEYVISCVFHSASTEKKIKYTGYCYQTNDWSGVNEYSGREKWEIETELRPIPKEQTITWEAIEEITGWHPNKVTS